MQLKSPTARCQVQEYWLNCDECCLLQLNTYGLPLLNFSPCRSNFPLIFPEVTYACKRKSPRLRELFSAARCRTTQPRGPGPIAPNLVRFIKVRWAFAGISLNELDSYSKLHRQAGLGYVTRFIVLPHSLPLSPPFSTKLVGGGDGRFRRM